MKMSVVIEGSSKQLQAAMLAAKMSTDSAGKGIAATMKKIGKSMAKASAAAVVFAAAITGVFIKKSVSTFIEFEVAMTRMGATLGETNFETGELNESMDKLETTIRDIAKVSQATASEVARAGNVLALAGLQIDQLGTNTKGAIKSLVDFSVVAGVDVESAAGIVISSVKGMGIAIEDMDRVMDVFVTTMTSSFTDLTSLGMAMKFLAPTANAAGLEIEEAAAAVGALGDSGLQATIAGTGLRMSINKLLSPTDDARRVMDRLGLSFLVLTPAGERADIALRAVSRTIEGTKNELERATFALDILNSKLEDLSIDQQRNSLAIMSIKQRADREGRTLTEAEIKRIGKLELANSGLAVEAAKAGLAQSIQTREQKKMSSSLAEQESQFKSLKDITASQTMGLTSLTDVVNQLAAAGTTTAEILEIFSVRGGTAMMALMGQRQAFLQLVDANYQAKGATESYLASLMLTTDYQMKTVNSSFEETRLVIGELFAELLTMDDGIADWLKSFSDMLKEEEDSFISLRDSIATDLIPMMEYMLELSRTFINVFQALQPIFRIIAGLLGGIWFFLKPILDGLSWMFEKIDALENSKWGRIFNDTWGGAATGGAAGATVGAIAGGGVASWATAPILGGVGAVAGGVIGGVTSASNEGVLPSRDSLFHKGGVAEKPTRGIFGEAGREALVPLTKYDMSLTKKGLNPSSSKSYNSSNTTEGSYTFNFENITINGGTNVTPENIRSIISAEMPRIVKHSYRGVKGVF